MATISLSPKFQIVMPTSMDTALHQRAWQQQEANVTVGKMALTPLQPMQAARGMFAGIDTRVPNDNKASHDPIR